MIATPAVTHGALVNRALDAGKHVFVEKPVCLDVEEAEELREKANALGRVLMVGHLLLYHPAFEALLATERAGELGRLRYVYSNRASLGKIRREENALWSFAPHDISMILQLAGRLPDKVMASGSNFLAEGIADTTLSHLDFGEGLQAHIFVSWLHPYKDQRLVVVGDKAMAVFNDVETGDGKLLLYRHKAHWDGSLSVIAEAEAEPIAYGTDEPLERECRVFLEAAAGRGVKPPSDAAEGVRVLRVLDACQRAINEGGSVAL
jgi:UDP-2-acetamido-3-amino-2,3-dideoxy-glucuronate N-acetyltransferase